MFARSQQRLPTQAQRVRYRHFCMTVRKPLRSFQHVPPPRNRVYASARKFRLEKSHRTEVGGFSVSAWVGAKPLNRRWATVYQELVRPRDGAHRLLVVQNRVPLLYQSHHVFSVVVSVRLSADPVDVLGGSSEDRDGVMAHEHHVFQSIYSTDHSILH